MGRDASGMKLWKITWQGRGGIVRSAWRGSKHAAQARRIRADRENRDCFPHRPPAKIEWMTIPSTRFEMIDFLNMNGISPGE